jgi:hypothetical protein
MFTPRAGQYQKLTISLIDRGMGRGAGLDNQFCVWPEGPCEWSRYRPYTLRYLRFEGKDLSVKEPGPLPNVVPGEHALSVLKEMYAQPAPGYVVIEGGFSEPQSRITVYDHCGKPSEVRASLSSVLERLYLPDSPFYATIRERATKG